MAKTEVCAVVIELNSPYPPVNPDALFYDVRVHDISSRAEILKEVAKIRYEELDGNDCDIKRRKKKRREIREGLSLQFTLPVETEVLKDFRT